MNRIKLDPTTRLVLVSVVLVVVAWIIVGLDINVWNPGRGADNWIGITIAFIWTLFVVWNLSGHIQDTYKK